MSEAWHHLATNGTRRAIKPNLVPRPRNAAFQETAGKPCAKIRFDRHRNRKREWDRPMETVALGEVDLPSGILVILDPGLARFWRHDGDPASPRRGDPAEVDLDIVGADAERAGRAYDRQFDPRYLYDVRDAEKAIAHFAEFCREQGLDARAVVCRERIPHTARALSAVAAGAGLNVVQYNGLWGVVIGGLPKKLRVVGHVLDGEFASRFRVIELFAERRAIARSRSVEGVMVDYGELLCVGLEPLGAFRMWESLDGLADFVFHGRDAAELAREMKAQPLDDESFGWRDVPMNEVGRHAQAVQERIAKEQLAIDVDYRPHDNLERLNAQIRSSQGQSGQLTLEGSLACGFANRWGDGIFEVAADYDASGQCVRVRIEVGNEQTQARMRAVRLLSSSAIVSRKILDSLEAVRFAERMEPSNGTDSGWLFTSGSESQEFVEEPDNFAQVPLGDMLQRQPALKEIYQSPVGSTFRLVANRYQAD
jgi:hypothetical protein